ncbi:Bug family tripartite tricarboxylate transporter substrate binding protein [Cupriavidus plantarum]|uniref:Bug family tripartite tricarboxylate transporter substrate binding protein n=1 Tax=Cupriavidus plantarum TaxID=942865 RepID=UPI0015CC2AD3|nr:tripartite tricarboxylate transporter substrate binding protein [Cupriavidus plantarum]NYI02773.1 tripartite-type tricarboxylate transporter receptor subunit TctC [Cupriavidus plantarum]
MRPLVRLCLAAAGALLLGAGRGAAAADDAAAFPARVVKIVVPYTAGGATDAVARSLANRLGAVWKQPVVVENRGGASGMIGFDYVAKSAPDGYTLVLADSAPFVILPALYPKMSYSPQRDFAPITVVARQIPILAVSAEVPAKNVGEFLAYLRTHPDAAYGSLGAGSYPHVAMEQFLQRSGSRMLHVPYKGTSQVVTDIIGGQISAYIGTLGAFESYEKAGKVRILAVATDKRVVFRPDLPTVAESGVPGFAVNTWFGLAAPKNTPPAVLDKIHRDVSALLADKVFIDQALTPQSLLPGGDSRREFGELVKADTARWADAVRRAGVKL